MKRGIWANRMNQSLDTHPAGTAAKVKKKKSTGIIWGNLVCSHKLSLIMKNTLICHLETTIPQDSGAWVGVRNKGNWFHSPSQTILKYLQESIFSYSVSRHTGSSAVLGTWGLCLLSSWWEYACNVTFFLLMITEFLDMKKAALLRQFTNVRIKLSGWSQQNF